jgi:hypothetical protein
MQTVDMFRYCSSVNKEATGANLHCIFGVFHFTNEDEEHEVASVTEGLQHRQSEGSQPTESVTEAHTGPVIARKAW